MSPLYVIDAQILELLRVVDEDTGEMSDETLAQMDKLAMERIKKIGNVASYIKSLQTEAEAIDAEKAVLKQAIAELDHKAAVKLNQVERLKEYLRRSLLAMQQEKVQAGIWTVAIVNNGGNPQVIYNGELDKLPDWAVVVNKAMNSKEIIARCKAGDKPPEGVQLMRGKHLSIK